MTGLKGILGDSVGHTPASTLLFMFLLIIIVLGAFLIFLLNFILLGLLQGQRGYMKGWGDERYQDVWCEKHKESIKHLFFFFKKKNSTEYIYLPNTRAKHSCKLQWAKHKANFPTEHQRQHIRYWTLKDCIKATAKGKQQRNRCACRSSPRWTSYAEPR